MPKKAALPQNLPPRLVNLEAAAAYVDLSATKFGELVREGRAPKPKRIDSRKAWDVRDLDAFADHLPYDSGATAIDQSWGDVDAA